jgi:hypothetical protein
MTCKTNERFALNTRTTKQFFADNKIVAFKALRDKNPEVDPFLEEIGNTGKGIPYYAVFRPGAGEPIQFDGIFFKSQQMLDKIAPAVLPGADATPPPIATR